MLDHVFRRPSVRDRIRANPLGKWVPEYIAYLIARGHPPHLIQEYVRSVEHFGCWLASEHLAIEELTRVTIRSFLSDHLPACRCPGPAPTTFRFVRAALNHLMRLPGGPMQRPRPAAPDTTARAVEYTFRCLRAHLPGPARPEGRAPRIHDIRHTFACRRLLRWYAEGVDLDHAVLTLATYLGHAQVKHTYWYLTAIPELFALAAARFEQFGALDQGVPS